MIVVGELEDVAWCEYYRYGATASARHKHMVPYDMIGCLRGHLSFLVVLSSEAHNVRWNRGRLLLSRTPHLDIRNVDYHHSYSMAFSLLIFN